MPFLLLLGFLLLPELASANPWPEAEFPYTLKVVPVAVLSEVVLVSLLLRQLVARRLLFFVLVLTVNIGSWLVFSIWVCTRFRTLLTLDVSVAMHPYDVLIGETAVFLVEAAIIGCLAMCWCKLSDPTLLRRKVLIKVAAAVFIGNVLSYLIGLVGLQLVAASNSGDYPRGLMIVDPKVFTLPMECLAWPGSELKVESSQEYAAFYCAAALRGPIYRLAGQVQRLAAKRGFRFRELDTAPFGSYVSLGNACYDWDGLGSAAAARLLLDRRAGLSAFEVLTKKLPADQKAIDGLFRQLAKNPPQLAPEATVRELELLASQAPLYSANVSESFRQLVGKALAVTSSDPTVLTYPALMVLKHAAEYFAVTEEYAPTGSYTDVAGRHYAVNGPFVPYLRQRIGSAVAELLASKISQSNAIALNFLRESPSFYLAKEVQEVLPDYPEALRLSLESGGNWYDVGLTQFGAQEFSVLRRALHKWMRSGDLKVVEYALGLYQKPDSLRSEEQLTADEVAALGELFGHPDLMIRIKAAEVALKVQAPAALIERLQAAMKKTAVSEEICSGNLKEHFALETACVPYWGQAVRTGNAAQQMAALDRLKRCGQPAILELLRSFSAVDKSLRPFMILALQDMDDPTVQSEEGRALTEFCQGQVGSVAAAFSRSRNSDLTDSLLLPLCAPRVGTALFSAIEAERSKNQSSAAAP